MLRFLGQVLDSLLLMIQKCFEFSLLFTLVFSITLHQLAFLRRCLHLEVEQLTSELLYLDELRYILGLLVRCKLVVKILVCEFVQVQLERIEVSLENLQNFKLVHEGLIDSIVFEDELLKD